MSRAFDRRRALLGALAGGGALAALGGCASFSGNGARAQVVVVGGGFGGATCARYLALWGAGAVEVTLIERSPQFISCPVSNLVVVGARALDDLTRGYAGLTRLGVRVVRDEVAAVEPDARTLKLASGNTLRYDRLVLSPGVEFDYSRLRGLDNPGAQREILHAWKAGPQTVALRDQLAAMPDGGVYALCIPRAPYRCPPGPYERATLVAWWLKRHKPRAKVLVLDANDEVVSKKALFTALWAREYAGVLEYRPQSTLHDVDVSTRTALLEFEKVRADVLNVLPPQRAGEIAQQAGLVNVNQRWCGVDWLSMESTAAPGIHVLGDATFAAPAMPKSGHMANQHAKVAAAAILRLVAGQAPDEAPMMVNTCYSYVTPDAAMHVASVHAYDEASRTMQPVKGAGGLSPAPGAAEGRIADDWARSIWADTLGV